MKKNIFHRELLTALRLATGKAKRAANRLASNQQQTLQGLAGTPFVTRGQGYTVQPNKVDFDVRKLLKRKEVPRDCMILSEHGNFCIKRCKISSDVCFMRLFPAKTTSLLRIPRIASPTMTRTQTSKLSISPRVNRCESTAA
jgi:hypothetical protein